MKGFEYKEQRVLAVIEPILKQPTKPGVTVDAMKSINEVTNQINDILHDL